MPEATPREPPRASTVAHKADADVLNALDPARAVPPACTPVLPVVGGWRAAQPVAPGAPRAG